MSKRTSNAAEKGVNQVTETAPEEAKAEAEGKTVPLADEVKEEDLPSREDEDVAVLSTGPERPRTADADDDNIGWTNQQAEVEDEKDRRTFVSPEDRPGQYVSKEELPTKEGLRDIGVTDPAAYLASVPVKE